jgi:hypothetical protein
VENSTQLSLSAEGFFNENTPEEGQKSNPERWKSVDCSLKRLAMNGGFSSSQSLIDRVNRT